MTMLNMPPEKLARVRIGAPIGLAVLVCLAIWLFVWPASRIAPRDVPMGVVGSDRLAAQLSTGDAFDVHAYADDESARTAIEDREVYGAVVSDGSATRLLIATAASPTVAQVLQDGVGSQLAGQVTVEDVVPADPDDPRMSAFTSSVLPLLFVGIFVGVIAVLITRRFAGRLVALVGCAVMAGLIVVAIAQGWLGVLSGDWWTNAAALALIVLSIGTTVAGLLAVLGPAGIGLAALLMMFIGNPFSGATSAPELLPSPVGAIGQAFPPGAGANLLRSTAFFSGSGAWGHALVLACWAVGGALLLAVARRRSAAAEVAGVVADAEDSVAGDRVGSKPIHDVYEG